MDNTLMAAVRETHPLQRETLDLLMKQKVAKEYYSAEEVAALLDKAVFTVRDWCRNGRAKAQKQASGRGKHQA